MDLLSSGVTLHNRGHGLQVAFSGTNTRGGIQYGTSGIMQSIYATHKDWRFTGGIIRSGDFYLKASNNPERMIYYVRLTNNTVTKENWVVNGRAIPIADEEDRFHTALKYRDFLNIHETYLFFKQHIDTTHEEWKRIKADVEKHFRAESGNPCKP